MSNQLLSNQEVVRAFLDEVWQRGGTVTALHDLESIVYARAILNQRTELRSRDWIRAGIVLRADQAEIRIDPYVVREPGRAGAIMLGAISSAPIDRDDPAVRVDLQQRVGCLCGEKVFESSLELLQIAMTDPLDLADCLADLFAHLQLEEPYEIIREIMDCLPDQRDHSRYGLFCAVLAAAEATAQPELRCRLEELAGCIAAQTIPICAARSAASRQIEIPNRI